MALETKVVGPEFAVEIRGVDLSRPLDANTVEEIRQVWMQNKIAVFPGQDLDEDGMLEFTRPFGPLFTHVRSQFHSKKHKEVMILTNTVKYDDTRGDTSKNSDLAWHSDQTYTARPVWASILHAKQIPSAGGATWFADLTRAYEELPDDLRRRVEGVKVRYSILGPERTMSQVAPEEQRKASPDVVHPILRKHPYLDRTVLYISPAHTMRVEGMEEAEGLALIRDLEEWASQPRFTYAHQWTLGDVVMWDNTQTMHRRDSYPSGEARTMLRTGFYLPEALGVPMAA